MARKIISEEITKKENEQSEVQEVAEQSSVMASDDVGSTLITAAELTKLFREWDANGNADLVVNESLAQRIEQYLAYQEQLDPLKRKLAKRIYQPYVCIGYEEVFADLYVNSNHIGRVKIYCARVGEYNYRILKLVDFKALLITIGNPYAIWIENKNDEVNAYEYVVANGGTFLYDPKNKRIEVTI